MCYHEWLLRASAKRVKGTHAKGNALFGIGGFELFLILLFGFLLFGPDKLPAMAKTLGKAIGKFRNAQEEMNKVIKNEVYDPDSDEPFKNPLDVMEKAADAGKKAANGASKAVSSASKAVSSHSSSAAASKPRSAGQQESFSERKARYDRERAAKQAAEAERAEAAKQAALAAADAKSTEAAAPETAAQAAPAAPAAPAASAAESSATETKGE